MSRIMNLVTLIIFLLITSCTNIKNNNSQIPSWYLNPPKNDFSFLYGVGYGLSLDQATKYALLNISERLSVTISSEYEDQKQEVKVNDNALYEQGIFSNIDSKTQEIEFSNYDIIKSENQGQKIYVLLKIARSDLISSYVKKVEELDQDIDIKIKNINSKSVIEQFVILKEVKLMIEENKVFIGLINSISEGQDYNKYNKKYKSILMMENDLKGSIVIKIIAKPSDKNVSDIIAKNLNNMQIKVSENLDPTNRNHIILRINTKTIKQKIYQNYIVNIEVYLKLMENYGNQIASNNITLKGSSTIDSVNSISEAINMLQLQIDQNGLFKIIGLN